MAVTVKLRPSVQSGSSHQCFGGMYCLHLEGRRALIHSSAWKMEAVCSPQTLLCVCRNYAASHYRRW